MVTVMFACTGEPFIWNWLAAHAGGGVALVATVQLRVTVAEKPFVGVIVVAKVVELPAITVAAAGVGIDNEKLPSAVTARFTLAG